MTTDQLNPKTAFFVMTVIFFMWGFITEFNDVLIPHLKAAFDLDYWQAMLVQFCFFAAYFVMAVPAGFIVSRTSYKRSIVAGLTISGIGSMAILLAAGFGSYELVLLALFVLGSGIVLLQCAANPYVSLLGVPSRAASRLNFAQAVNSLGHILGPVVGGSLIFSTSGLPVKELATMSRADRIQAVHPLYFGVALVLLLLAFIVTLCPLPSCNDSPHSRAAPSFSLAALLRIPTVRFGVVAVFLYVGAEVALGSFLASYAMHPEIAGFSAQHASTWVSVYWCLAMIGRFAGAILLLRIAPRALLAVFACSNIALLTAAIALTGLPSLCALTFAGFFNSIMFPTIFVIAVEKLGILTEKTSSLMIMAISGGAILPLAQGKIVDILQASLGSEIHALQAAFLLPAFCYVYIAWFARQQFVASEPTVSARGKLS